tara:strand:- start:733 stop:978 length:246 start_codon:yes stop_codon:yes gene_type:complete
MKLIKRTKLQYFIDVNGMDVLSTSSMETITIIDGAEMISLEEAEKYMFESYFSFMWNTVAEFCGVTEWNEEEFEANSLYSS